MFIQGKARRVGDNVNTDQMYPTRYTSIVEDSEMAKHNIGLPIVICTEAVDDCQELDELAIDFDKGILMNVTRNKTYEITPFPAFINDIMNCGGLINRIKRNLFS